MSQFAEKASIKHESRHIETPQVGTNFTHNIFSFVTAKSITFTDCDFSHCKLNDCYFSECTFENCKFTGAKFVDSNLRKSDFNGCNFDYTDFRNTKLDYKRIKASLPALASIRMKVLPILRKNFESLGDLPTVRMVLSDEINAQREHYKEALFAESTYYKKTLKSRAIAGWNWFRLTVGKWSWGFGENPIFLTFTIILLIFVVSSATFIPDQYLLSPMNTPMPDSIYAFFSRFSDATLAFLGVTVIDSQLSTLTKGILAVLRLIVISLLTSSIIKRFGWR